MNTIKFSHYYRKLYESNPMGVILLDVIKINLEKLSEAFIDYDTDDGIYKLPLKGKYMLLIYDKGFRGKKNIFITIRRWTPQKESYYKSKINELFKVEIIQ